MTTPTESETAALEAAIVEHIRQRASHLWQLERLHAARRMAVEPALYRLRKAGVLIYDRNRQLWSLR
jgi:hypothetical protein